MVGRGEKKKGQGGYLGGCFFFFSSFFLESQVYFGTQVLHIAGAFFFMDENQYGKIDTEKEGRKRPSFLHHMMHDFGLKNVFHVQSY